MRYQGGMLHIKAILIDENISFIGTVNMDMRSFYLKLEVTLAVHDGSFRPVLKRQLSITYPVRKSLVLIHGMTDQESNF